MIVEMTSAPTCLNLCTVLQMRWKDGRGLILGQKKEEKQNEGYLGVEKEVIGKLIVVSPPCVQCDPLETLQN